MTIFDASIPLRKRLNNALKIMMLASSKRASDKIAEILRSITKKESVEKIIIVGTQDLIRELGQVLSKKPFFDKRKVSLIVFKENYPEENALKIMIKHGPDIIIDCDYSNSLYHLRELIGVGRKKVFKCDLELIKDWFM